MEKKEKVKITALISSDVEEDLREYIQKNFNRPYGKLSEVIEKSIQEYLERKGNIREEVK